MDYIPRIVDSELDELLTGISAIALEGPKAVGKTETALRRAKTVFRFDQPHDRSLAELDPQIMVTAPGPVLLDEWQHLPYLWDVVRRAVDADPSPGRFILTGSASPKAPPTHSGAGRIVTVRLRPLSIAERRIDTPTVHLAELLESDGQKVSINGQSGCTAREYVDEITGSGFPAIRSAKGHARLTLIDGYLRRIVDRDFNEMGHAVRKPEMLRRWLAAYGAATSTTASWETIRDAATSGLADKPAKSTTLPYRDVLEKLWILEPLPAWIPSRNYLSRLTQPPKHHLADPALVAGLLGVDTNALLSGQKTNPSPPRDGMLLGHLFESLIVQSVRVYAQNSFARVYHLRTMEGRQEIDLIVERRNGRFLAIEVKLSQHISDKDTIHLNWLKNKAGDEMLDALVIYTGKYAYRRKDGIAVVPAALLGP